MDSFTVVTYHTPDFSRFLPGIAADCERFGYRLYSEETAKNYSRLIDAFDHKISFLQRTVERFGRVLWLDVECRIVRAIPNDWASPLITSYTIGAQDGMSSGVLMLDRQQRDLLALWLKYAKRNKQYPDDFVLDFLASNLPHPFRLIPFEFVDRETTAAVVRGQWANSHTIIQHPTINRWPDPRRYRKVFEGDRSTNSSKDSIPRLRKKLFYRNFGGDFHHVEHIMASGASEPELYAGWVFDASDWSYAPELFWPGHSEDFNVKPLTFEKFQQQWRDHSTGSDYRHSAIRKMKLDRRDRAV